MEILLVDVERILRQALKMYFNEVRKSHGGSQSDFAEKMHVSQQTVSNIASGAGQVTVEQLAELAKIEGRSAVGTLTHLIEIVEQLQRHPGKSPTRMVTRSGRIGVVASEEGETTPRTGKRREHERDKRPTEEDQHPPSSHKRRHPDQEPDAPPPDDTVPPRR